MTTKQDLWWRERKIVSEHYRQGEYSSIIKSLGDAMSDGRVRHEYAFASLAIANFKTGRGESLKSNCAGYDQLQQANSIRRLFELMGDLRKWEMTA